VYEEEGESERSQQWGPQIGGKCERDFIGYSNSYNGNSNRRQQQLKASAQGRYGEVTCSRDATVSERYTSFEHGGEVFQSFARSTKHRFQRHQYQGGSGESRGGCVQLAAAATGNG